MVQAQVELEINCPIEEVFDLWADMRNDKEWHPMAEEDAEMVTAEPLQVGTVFKGKYKGMGMVTEETVAFERPFNLSRRGSAKNYRMESTFTFEELASDKTKLKATGKVTPLGFMKIMTPLMKMMMQRQLYQVMYQLKITAENRYKNRNKSRA